MVLNAARQNANADGHRMCLYVVCHRRRTVADQMYSGRSLSGVLCGMFHWVYRRDGELLQQVTLSNCLSNIILITRISSDMHILRLVNFPHVQSSRLVLKGILALYGKPYIAAAKDTWRLFTEKGIDALVNDSLVGMSMSPSISTICFR